MRYHFLTNLTVLIFLSVNCHQLIDITKVNPTIAIDLRYATTNNFTGKTVYAKSICYVHQDIAPLLDNIQKELKQYGLCLKIWDAYRPVEAQQAFWDIVHDEQYVSHPTKGMRVHLRGVAVDVTLIDLKTGKELPMPTEFDDFSEKAHANYTQGISKEAVENRTKLQAIMLKHGFTFLSSKWWHFNKKNWQEYPVLDTKFEELA